MSTILVVEDVAAMREQYAYDLKRLGGHETRAAGGVREALEILERDTVDCVLLDLEMPGADGFQLLKELGARGIAVPVIVYTGTGDYDRCVRAVKLGAYGFLDKAEPMERVLREVENAIERSRLAAEVAELRSLVEEESSMVGTSRALAALRESIRRLAPIPSPVLVQGESGTGKELVARDLHRLGPRGKGPFVAVNCAALPENLVESELFGHERAAFTGADRMRRGAFERAGGGTLFLDEVGELPPAVQAKLLRVLEEDSLTRVGGAAPIALDARTVAATNRDLDAEAAAGRFRDDLLYRLNVHTIVVPPLRERLEDVPLLVHHFLGLTARRFGRRPLAIHPEALALLARHDWRRNNVRELRNAVERLVIAARGEEIAPEDVPASFRDEGARPSARSGTLKDLKADAEREIVLGALERNGWHVTNTAAELGLADHASLSKIMRRHGLKKK
jgi:two-component system nitrogen regulation response regulator NtrX